MRETAFLHYVSKDGFWHRHDPRLKLLELSFWSVLALVGGPMSLAVIGAVLIVVHAAAGTSLKRMAKPLLFWTVMAAAITAGSGFSDTGPGAVVFGYVLPFGLEGLAYGALRAARLLVVLIAGQFLASTTDPSAISGALRRITAFLPTAWSAALATAVSLTLAFIPEMMDQGAKVRDAAFSRGLGSRRSVFRRAMSLGLPLAESTLRRADLTSDALISRGIVEDPTPPEMHIKTADILAAAAVIFPGLISALFVGK